MPRASTLLLLASTLICACTSSRPIQPQPTTPPTPSASAVPSVATSPPPATPTWEWLELTITDDEVSLCVPPSSTSKIDRFPPSTVIATINGAGSASPIHIEVMQDFSGPYPMDATLPDGHSDEVLIRKEVLSNHSWMISSRYTKTGQVQAVVRIPDATGEDVLCTARALPAGRTEEQALTEVQALCRSMHRGKESGPCDPFQSIAAHEPSMPSRRP